MGACLRLLSGAAMTLALCCVAQAEGSVSVGLEAQPALVILDDETRTAPYSYIAEYQLTYGQQDEYFYPSLDTVLTPIPVPSVKPKRTVFQPATSPIKKQFRPLRKELAARVRRVSAPRVAAGRRITERLPIIVGLYR